MNAKEIFINLGNNVEIPINEDLEKALLKDTPGYKVIKDYIEQLEKEVELKDKVLDKTCNILVDTSDSFQCKNCWLKDDKCFGSTCIYESPCYIEEMTKEEWKVWCLNDE